MTDSQHIEKERVSTRERQLSKEDIDRLVSYVEEKAVSARRRGTKRGIIDELIILIFVHTGIRPGELCELNINNMKISDLGQVTLDVPGEHARTLSMPHVVYEKFQQYLALYREKDSPEMPLFRSEQGNRFSYQNVYLKIKSIGKKARIEDLQPYMLRHFFLCQLYEEEHNLKLVQKIGGYQDPKTAAFSLKLEI